MTSPAKAKPILKWAGGKSWFVREFGDAMFEHVASRGCYYLEPFLGGASMALHLGYKRMVLSDVEPDLMKTYAAIVGQTDDVVSGLAELADHTDKDSYYAMRDVEPEDYVEVAVRMLYLNKLCFNGLHRKNKSGKFNVPYGGQERRLTGEKDIRAAAEALTPEGTMADIQLHVRDFKATVDQARQGDVVYADPPYDGTFTDYTKGGFDESDQSYLAQALHDATKRGADVFAHNADTELVRKLYSWATVVEMPEKRTINSQGDQRGKVPCVLITNAQL